MENLTLIIPAKFEKDSLPIFLEEIRHYNCKKMVISELSDIETINQAKKFKDVEVLIQKNTGYGSAIREGIGNSKTKYFCIINADGSMNPSYLENMLNVLEDKNLDFLFTSRYAFPGGGSEDDNFITYFGNFFFSKLGNFFFSLNISDILFTYVMGKVDAFNSLNLNSKDFTLCVEFPIKIVRLNFKYQVIPSFERRRIAGKKKVNAFKDGALILYAMIKLFIEKIAASNK
tara:strand:+ start:7999 stop:8691 length:693 start_codon:yes stop_codon:yes gene_type:complete